MALAALAVGLLGWRAALPNNQHRDLDIYAPPAEGEMWGQTTNGYDDVVTIVTAHNFARDGFLRTHLLPNRRGAPLVSYFDFSHTQCEALAPSGRPLVYPGFWQEPTEMVSLRDDCIYTHYPPLADWVFGAMATLGLGRVLHYKLLAVLLHGALVLALYAWLRREVHAGAALAAIAMVATAPAFFEWAGALYYQPFQYLFLVAGMLCWSLYLERPRRCWVALTWLLFFCEALVSYELVAFFGIALAGYFLLARSDRSWSARARLLALQASAPAAATLIHFGLRVSLFGLTRTWDNARITVRTRMVEGFEAWRVELWLNRVHFKLLPFGLMALALVLIVGIRLADGGVRRPLALLAMLLIGGLSFACVFPGMAIMHTWMMYRHLLPFVAALMAYLVDALGSAVRLASARSHAGPLRAARVSVAALAAILCCVPLSWAAWRSGRAIAAEVAWNAAANRHHDPLNLAVRFLDALYWRESGPQAYSPAILTPLDGHRVDEPAHPSPEFVIGPGATSHYEIWWLEEVEFAQVSFLTDEASATGLTSGCGLSFFDGEAFSPPRDPPRVERLPFVPGPGEHWRPYAWVRFPVAARSRAIRLTCSALASIPLHHLEVLSSPRQP